MITVRINLTDVMDEDYVECLLDEFQKVQDDLGCVMDFEQVSSVEIVICYYSSTPDDHDYLEYELGNICDKYPIASIETDFIEFLDTEG